MHLNSPLLVAALSAHSCPSHRHRLGDSYLHPHAVKHTRDTTRPSIMNDENRATGRPQRRHRVDMALAFPPKRDRSTFYLDGRVEPLEAYGGRPPLDWTHGDAIIKACPHHRSVPAYGHCNTRRWRRGIGM